MKHHVWDGVISVWLILFSVIIWLPSRYYPLFWDSTYVVNTARDIAQSGFTNFSSTQLGYAHTTLFSIALALIWKLFGISPAVSHVLTLPFLPILLISTYFLIKKQTNRELALLGSMVVAFTPTVLSEYVNVYVDLPTGALVALSAVFWQNKQRTGWMVSFVAAILTKVTALIAVPYFVFEAFREKKNRLLSIFYPTSITVAWFVYHYATTGWWFNKRNSPQHLAIFDGVASIANNWYQIMLNVLFGQGRWLMVLIALVAIAYLYIKRKPLRTLFQSSILRSSCLVIVFGALFFAVTGEFSFRYAILTYPFFVSAISLILFWVIQEEKQFAVFIYGLCIATLIFMSSLWHPKEATLTTNRFEPPTDLGVIDYITIFKWLGYYGQINNQPNTIFYGAFPENNAFMEPRMGYVTSPVNFQPCEVFKMDDSKKQIVIFHPFSPSQYACYTLVQTGNFTELGGIERNGKWIDLYVAASASATKTQP